MTIFSSSKPVYVALVTGVSPSIRKEIMDWIGDRIVGQAAVIRGNDAFHCEFYVRPKIETDMFGEPNPAAMSRTTAHFAIMFTDETDLVQFNIQFSGVTQDPPTNSR